MEFKMQLSIAAAAAANILISNKKNYVDYSGQWIHSNRDITCDKWWEYWIFFTRDSEDSWKMEQALEEINEKLNDLQVLCPHLTEN